MDNTQNIDKLAQSFFIVLVFCSVASDSYIFINNILKNSYVKKKINYLKKMYKIARGLTLQNYVSDHEGNIIIDDDDINTNTKKDINKDEEDINKDEEDINKDEEDINEKDINEEDINKDEEDINKDEEESTEKKNFNDNLELEIEHDYDIEDEELDETNDKDLDEPIVNNESELYTENDINPIKEILENIQQCEQHNILEREYLENTNSITYLIDELDRINNRDSSICTKDNIDEEIEVKKTKKNSKKNIKEVVIKHQIKKNKNDKFKK